MTSTFAARIRSQARRILAGMVKGSKDRRIFPGYIPFEGPERPLWWRNEQIPESWGEVLGVHEFERGASRNAIVVTELGLGVFAEPVAPTWLPYADVAGWGQLSKEPVSQSLKVRTKTGTEVELFFHDAEAFAFVQFIGYATEQLIREQKRREEASRSH